MNYTDIINQVVAEAVDHEVENRLAAKNGEIASLKALLGDRDREVAKLIDDINEIKKKDFQNAPLDGDAITRTYGTGLMSAVHVQQKVIDDLRGELSAANAVVDTVKTLPTWKDKDLTEWKGSETKAVIFYLREFMLSVGASTAKGLENELERAQGAPSRDNEVKSLQVELKGVRDALKKHVDSEESLRKDLEKANDRICELDALVDDREAELEKLRDALGKYISKGDAKYNDQKNLLEIAHADIDDKETEIERLNGVIEEKDELIEKYKDMADAISDWSTNDMPSLDPDDY